MDMVKNKFPNMKHHFNHKYTHHKNIFTCHNVNISAKFYFHSDFNLSVNTNVCDGLLSYFWHLKLKSTVEEVEKKRYYQRGLFFFALHEK